MMSLRMYVRTFLFPTAAETSAMQDVDAKNNAGLEDKE